MGRRSNTETLAKLLVAFLEQRTWKQRDLERRCGVGARAVRIRILDLIQAGVPIEREEDHPHVYYSVRAGWFPERGTGIEHLDFPRVARMLGRLPRTPARDRLLTRLVTTAFGSPSAPNAEVADIDDRTLDVLEDGARRRVPVRIGYYTASRGEPGLRTVSVQRIVYGAPLRLVGYCHRANSLKWFRGDRVTSPELDSGATFMEVAARDVDSLIASSLNGYSEPGDALSCAFVLRPRESHWVLRNLPRGAQATASEDAAGVRVSLRTTGLEVLARYLTGLGSIVHSIEPEKLRRRVQQIALEAVAASGARLTKHSARPIRSAS